MLLKLAASKIKSVTSTILMNSNLHNVNLASILSVSVRLIENRLTDFFRLTGNIANWNLPHYSLQKLRHTFSLDHNAAKLIRCRLDAHVLSIADSHWLSSVMYDIKRDAVCHVKIAGSQPTAIILSHYWQSLIFCRLRHLRWVGFRATWRILPSLMSAYRRDFANAEVNAV